MCFTCASANARKLLKPNTRRDEAFISTGFSNWKKATERFLQHETSDCHAEAIQKLVAQNQEPINAFLSKQCQEEQHIAQKALWLIFSSVRYLARQGLSLRGDDHKDGNLYQLLKERSVDVPEMAIWLQRRDNWTSDKIQNEILEMFAHTIHRSIMSDLQNVEFYSITADGTTDIAGQEQFSVTLRYVQPDLTYRNVFPGFYNCPDSTGESLFKAICDIILRLNLPMERIQGYCFDGASNMSGMVKGVQARLQERCPHIVFMSTAQTILWI